MASPDAPAPTAPEATFVAHQLETILASRHLAGSDRLKRFLRFVVEETLAGRASTLKEYTIGVQVYDRGEAFDPKGDSIVRGEANRLRGRLADYYADPATHDDVRIDLPKGSYVPIFRRTPAADAADAPRRRSSLAALVVVLVVGVTGGVLVGLRTPTLPASPGAVMRMELDVRPAQEVNSGRAGESGEAWMPTRGGSRTALAWTPDGRGLVFVGRRDGVQQLYVRQLDATEARALPNTEGAQAAAVTPNGRDVVFLAGADIKRVPLADGPVQTILQGEGWGTPSGLTVAGSGAVFFDAGGIVQSVERRAVSVTSPSDSETMHILPQLVAHDRVLLYTARRSLFVWGEEAVVAHVLATGARTVLLRDAADAHYIPPGYLVFMRRGLLMAVPFDLDRLEVRGEPVAMVGAIAQALTSGHGSNINGAGQFSVSATGTLAYVPSPVVTLREAEVMSVDRRGRRSALPLDVRGYHEGLRLSPDGRSLGVVISSLTEQALWVADLIRGTLTRLTGSGEATGPRWTPDGQRIAFHWIKEGVAQLAWQRADGSAAPELLASGDLYPSSWSPDGRHLVALKDGDIWVLTLGGGQPILSRLADTPDEEERSPEFSPDGNWVAYTSNRSDRFEIYVRPFPGPGPATAVSLMGGMNPAWNPRGGELLFLAPSVAPGEWQMMTVGFEAGRPSVPRALFTLERGLDWGCVPVRCYDVTPDGQRFLAMRQVPRDPPPPVTHINLVLNWVEELKAKVPVRGDR